MGKSKILSIISVLAMIVISFSFMACGSGNKAQSLAIRYDDESFYLGDKKNEIDKILGSPTSNESYNNIIRYCYIGYTNGAYVDYDNEEKCKRIEVMSEQISVNGIKIGDNRCDDKVREMFPKNEHIYKQIYEGTQGYYNIYMKNNQNVDKDTYDKYKDDNTDIYYWIMIAHSSDRKVTRIIIGK